MARNKSIRFMNNQLAHTGNTVFSSSTGTFPSSNVFNTSRSRVWTPSGHFLIDDTNNQFNANGFSASVANGNYATPAALVVALNTALDTITSGWAFAYSDVTKLFSITAPSIVVIDLSITTNSIWDTIGFGSAIYSSGVSYTAPAPRIHTSEYLSIDLGIAQHVSFVGLIGPLDELFSLSEQAVVTISASNLPDLTTPAFSVMATITTGGVLEFIDTDNEEDTTYRYWKIDIQDRENIDGTDSLKFGFCYLGNAKTFTTTNVAKGFSKNITDPSKKSTSEGGQLFFQTKPKYYQFKSMSIELMDQVERLEVEQLFYDMGISEPMFISIDPTQSISLTADEYTKYCIFDSAPDFKHVFLDYYSLSLSLREVL